MTLTELPEWAWWAVALAGALVHVGVALVIALAVAGAISLRENAPRPVPIAIPAQRSPERGRRRLPCTPGRPCGLHHPIICVASACCDRHCPTAEAEQSVGAPAWVDPLGPVLDAVIDARSAAWRRGDELVAVEMSQATLDDLVRATPQMTMINKIMGLPIVVNDSLSRGSVVGRSATEAQS